MSSQVQTPYQRDLASLEAAVEKALRAEKARIAGEIRSYPHPIPACDAQFNYLIEQRDLIKQELSRLHELVRRGSVDETMLQEFIATSTVLDSDSMGKRLYR